MPSADDPFANIKALAFDIFGTVVDWRSSVVSELTFRAFRKTYLDSNLLLQPPERRARIDRLSDEDWTRFAEAWRAKYFAFCAGFRFVPGTAQVWKSVDEHHLEALAELLREWDLEDLFTESEVASLSMVWHRLAPWPDVVPGLEELRAKKYATATLSNGNIAILRDLDDYGNLGFESILSAETFGAYKPDHAVYTGAAAELAVQPQEMALVAAHLYDLKAAHECGLRTIYVQRPDEEAWGEDEERYKEAKGWVDFWVSEDEDGFLTVAKRLSESK